MKFEYYLRKFMRKNDSVYPHPDDSKSQCGKIGRIPLSQAPFD